MEAITGTRTRSALPALAACEEKTGKKRAKKDQICCDLTGRGETGRVCRRSGLD